MVFTNSSSLSYSVSGQEFEKSLTKNERTFGDNQTKNLWEVLKDRVSIVELDQKLKENTQKWFQFITLTRLAMQQKGYEEVLTPNLVVAGAMESQLHPFITQFQSGQTEFGLQLPTSPEFHLKKLLALGWGDIFEIKPCFRNEELSHCHRPEFTMLEFYKLGASSKDLMLEVQGLVTKISQTMGFFEHPPQRKVAITDLFKALGISLTPQSTKEELLEHCQRLEIYTHKDDDFNELYFRIWLEKIEPSFNTNELTFVYDFPPSQAALAEINSKGWADRFEVFWQGFELGNAFKEMNDAKQLRQRYQTENLKRQSQGFTPHPLDEELIWASQNLPSCSGIAIGLERLFMAIMGFKSIAEFKILDFKSLSTRPKYK